jgi:hypothetical protein
MNIVTAKDIRLIWWSMFWRYFLYVQVVSVLIGMISGFFKDFLQDPAVHEFIRQNNIVTGALQGALEALASGMAITQSLKIHLPQLWDRFIASRQEGTSPPS